MKCFIFAISVLVAVTQTLSCEPDWIFSDGKCFKGSNTVRNWIDSLTFCQSEGGHLAGVNDARVDDIVALFSPGYEWIGYYRSPLTGLLEWIQDPGGVDITLKDDSGDCVLLRNNKKMYAVDCTELNRCVCEKGNSLNVASTDDITTDHSITSGVSTIESTTIPVITTEDATTLGTTEGITTIPVTTFFASTDDATTDKSTTTIPVTTLRATTGVTTHGTTEGITASLVASTEEVTTDPTATMCSPVPTIRTIGGVIVRRTTEIGVCLRGHLLHTIAVPSYVPCITMCVKKCNCKSVNIYPSPDVSISAWNLVCELNDWTSHDTSSYSTVIQEKCLHYEFY